MLCLTASLSLGLRVPISPRMAAPTSGEHELLAKFGLPKFEEISTDRRTALGLMAGAAAFSAVSPAQAQDGMFSVPPLPYAYDALEPHIDAATMKFHHDFHHQAYVNNLNKAMAGKDAASLVSLMPGAKAAKLNNAGGGHYNHVSVVAPPFSSRSLPPHTI